MILGARNFEKYTDMVRDIRITWGSMMTKKETEKMAGMHTFEMRFIHDVTHLYIEVYACLQMSTQMDLGMKVISWGLWKRWKKHPANSRSAILRAS